MLSEVKLLRIAGKVHGTGGGLGAPRRLCCSSAPQHPKRCESSAPIFTQKRALGPSSHS